MNYKEWVICLLGAALLAFVGTISCQKLAEVFWDEMIHQLGVERP